MTAQNLHQRLHAAMGEVDYVQKEKKAGMNYSIVSHDAVTAKVRPILHKHGVIYYPFKLLPRQDGNRTEVQAVIRFCNVDDPKDCIDVESLGYGIDSQDKGPGKAISYAVKYALLKALGLETGDDPDTESVEHEPAPKPEAKKFTLVHSDGNWDQFATGREFLSALEADMKRSGEPARYWQLNEKTANELAAAHAAAKPIVDRLKGLALAQGKAA